MQVRKQQLEPAMEQQTDCFQMGKGVCQGCILSPCFFNDPSDVGNLISVSSAFSKTSLNILKFMVHVLLNLTWRILSITLLACEMSVIVR